MDKMNEEEIENFLEEPNIAIIGTINKDGTPHITPVWFSYDGKEIYITTSHGRVKEKNIKRDSRISVLVSSAKGDRVVIMNGEAEVYEDSNGQRTKFMAERYIEDPAQRKEMIDFLMKETRVTIKMTPANTISWDAGKS